MRYITCFVALILGFLLGKFFYEQRSTSHKKEEIRVLVNEIKNLSKLVVSEGTFSEMYNYSDTKKYFYDYISFQKKAILSVNAKVEVGYDLSRLDIQLDSVSKQIIINGIPKEEVIIAPDIKYFDLKQSQFNSFSKEELNELNEKSIAKIKQTIEVTKLQEEAKARLFEELSKLYQLSKIYGWKVVDNTDTKLLESLPRIQQ